MSSIFNEVFGGKDTSKLTPIEIALGIDENGMTTARKLYDFLGMDRSNYSRWVKSNIVENQFAEENVDFWAIVTDDERSFNPNPTQDYKITAHFAKKLSMIVKNEKGEEARKYFVQIEDGAKKMVDMIRDTADYHIDAATLKGIASTGNLIRSTMRDQDAKPYKVAVVLDSLFKQSGLSLPSDFIVIPEYEQAELSDFLK
ncbi:MULTISPECIES: antA/AntB antirepressor family protein [Eisenbergiella]|uniref:antA/AntB antirepressor family protein n=2 Tax=Lachnospiraceae TaxID=186803 RepID=UPI0023F2C416|nr:MULTISPECIES: antA/AntB antirepressor family protein [Eisenbergiella]MCI6707911.1 antA/AntB antirepressor family protein [Eisenbergiella massiliensis]MDY5529309.1 antA/AntB antirepressor family protein [Eisenbergiella porci]